MKNKIFALIFACLTFLVFPVFANEAIHSFDSLIQVQADGSMIVTETLRVHHEGINIRRGIYRDLPTKKGEKYELIGVTRNGRYEPSFVERRSGYYRINTGDDSFLPRPATSTFEIKYKVWNIPRAYDGYDEVYWNVTGDEWSFPIENVSAKVELPYGADIIQQASYIGYKGSREPATYEGRGRYKGRYLSPGEQLTVAVGFTPGIVSTEKHISWEDILRNAIPFILYLVYLGFLIWAWYEKGRDPAKRAIMPQYEPPIKELTAAQAACLYNKKKTGNIVPISFIQMIANGFLKLTVEKEKILLFPHTVYILEKTGKAPSNFEEECISMNRIELDGQYHSFIESLVDRIKSKIEKSMKPYYAQNHEWVLCPTFLLLLFLFLMWWGWESLLREGLDSFSVFLAGICLLTFLGSFIFRTLLRQIIYTLVCAFLTFFLFNIFVDIPDDCQSLLILFIISTCSIFSFLMYQPTKKGQRMTEYLEGLKMFLTVTKLSAKERLNLEEKLNQETMEKLFPYAMALGLEKEWAKKFKKLFGLTEYGSFIHSHPYTSAHFIHSFSSSTSHSSGGSSGGGFGGSGGFGGGGGGFGGGGGGGR